MKIRIKGNSVRLRLGQDEVRRLNDVGSLKENTLISEVNQWSYSISKSDQSKIEIQLNSHSIDVFVPEYQLSHWANSDDVGIDENIENGTENGLRILIEKDFACLTERKGEDDSDAFPNPNSTC